MSDNKLSGLIIPMKVLAYRVDKETQVRELNPNYRTEEKKILIDNPQNIFNLNEGIHLHFILPSIFRHGNEIIDKDGNKTINYQCVPDKYIVTRMYVNEDGEIINDCNIVDSSFISKENEYNAITIPFLEENNKLSYRYLGRQYSGIKNISAQKQSEEKDDHLDKHKLFAVGPGDPMFNAYYPSCRSVFGYYDKLEHVPSDAVLTYSVIGYYSKSDNDPFNKVDSAETMNELLKKLGLSIDDKKFICNSCLLFGEVCKIDLNKPFTPLGGEVDTAIGRTSAEALSAIISQKNSNGKDIERTLTMIQYDLTDEVSQIDGNFKIDDSIHSHGFCSINPNENNIELIFPPNTQFNDPKNDISLRYSNLCNKKYEYGKLKRSLIYKKNTLYYLWELYIRKRYFIQQAKCELLKNKIDDTINEISVIRNNLIKQNKKINTLCQSLRDTLKIKIKNYKDIYNNIKIKEISTKPFYYPKDPVLMFYGNGMEHTYSFDEKKGTTLNCLTSPLTNTNNNATNKKFSFSNQSFIDEIDNENYLNYLVMTKIINEEPSEIQKKYPDMVNSNPYDEQFILFMSWETSFQPNYADCTPSNSSFLYNNTDYTYCKKENSNDKMCEKENCNDKKSEGTSVLTPYGVKNLGEKLEKYIEKFPDAFDKEFKQKIDEIKQTPAISQNLGGFTISLSGLKYAFQKRIEPDDECSKKVYDCLYPQNSNNIEPDIDRYAVIKDTEVIPLREGYLDLKKYSITTTFGFNFLDHINQNKPNINYISENLCANFKNSDDDNKCFLPLALTTPARLSSYFVSSANTSICSSSLPGSTPIIAIIMPDMLNKNLDIFDNTGELIGILKTKYITKSENGNDHKIAIGSFMQSPSYQKSITNTPIYPFIKLLETNEPSKDDSSYFAEIMNIITEKLNNTIPMDQSDFIFGRVLVLARMNIKLEYFGGTEFSKTIDYTEKKGGKDVLKLKDNGLSEYKIPVMIGDFKRLTDGVICGFYSNDSNENKTDDSIIADEFKNCFAAFGYDKETKLLNAAHPTVCGEDKKAKTVTLLLDPSLKVTLSTGILPVEQIEINANHTDFSKKNLKLAEMNTLISGTKTIQLPNFTKGERFTREFPQKDPNDKDNITYSTLEIINNNAQDYINDKTIITDGFIIKTSEGV